MQFIYSDTECSDKPHHIHMFQFLFRLIQGPKFLRAVYKAQTKFAKHSQILLIRIKATRSPVMSTMYNWFLVHLNVFFVLFMTPCVFIFTYGFFLPLLFLYIFSQVLGVKID